MTDSICEAQVLLHKDYQLALQSMRDAKAEGDRWESLRSVYDQRMRMIRELVSLYSSSYFTPAGMGAPSKALRDAAAATAREKLAEQRSQRNKA